MEQNTIKEKKNVAILSWNSGVNLTNKNDDNRNFLRFGSMVSSFLNENSTKMVITRNGVLKNLVVKLVTSTDIGDAFPGDGNARAFNIRKNGDDTPVSVLIADEHDFGKSKHKIKVAKGDLISLAHNVIGYPINNALAIASIELHF